MINWAASICQINLLFKLLLLLLLLLLVPNSPLGNFIWLDAAKSPPTHLPLFRSILSKILLLGQHKTFLFRAKICDSCHQQTFSKVGSTLPRPLLELSLSLCHGHTHPPTYSLPISLYLSLTNIFLSVFSSFLN